MPALDENLFGEMARIERQADELLETARAEAAKTRENAEAEAKKLAEEAGREIERTNDKLAEEYETKTAQALTEIDVDFLKREETLESIRESRFDELVEWTAARILERQMSPKLNGD